MNILPTLMKQKLFIQVMGVFALCGLIWFGGPLVAIKGTPPFDPVINRVLAIVVALFGFTLYKFITQARSARKDKNLIADLSAGEAASAESAVSEAKSEEKAALHRTFEESLQRLKETRSKGKYDKRYLYELPWYVIIGAPGSGKTTLLANSGLNFPLAERLGKRPVSGVGGTRNCDWFFADEAIFLDTAGRYSTQDSHQPVDAAAWNEFLGLIKKYRPRRPINGVLVTLSMSDLLRLTDAERGQHFTALRQRVLELYDVMGSRFPIYMIFTKCDLLAGFTEFFADLDQEERAQVWGETFPGEDSVPAESRLAIFDGNFNDLMNRLKQRTHPRIHAERDIQRRGLILGFPRQMELIKKAMMGFLQKTFGVSRYETASLLRGVYFTSGTQEGTPIDRVMGQLAATYGLDRQNLPVFSGRGKTFFITRLLEEVVIPEAEMAGVDPRMERRKQWFQWGAYALLLALTAGMSAVWTVSYTSNKRAISKTETQIERYGSHPKESTDPDAEVRTLVDRLDVLEAARDMDKDRSSWMGFGLYQGRRIQKGFSLLYDKLLLNQLLPVIEVHFEQQIRLMQEGKTDLEALQGLVRAYLMLGNPDRMDINLVMEGIRDVLMRGFPRATQMHERLTMHSANLLEILPGPIPLDQVLIADARRKLNAIPLELQIYAALKSKALKYDLPDFKLQDNLGIHGNDIFTTVDGRDLSSLTIPGLYTAHGYHSFFSKQGIEDIEQLLKDSWVVDNPVLRDRGSAVNRLYDNAQELYFADYEKTWRDLLNNLKVKEPRGFDGMIQAIGYLCDEKTPLHALLESVAKNTSLVKDPADAAPGPAKRLGSRFEALTFLLRQTGGSPPSLDHVRNTMNDVYRFLLQIRNSANSEEEALRTARQRMISAGSNDISTIARTDLDRLPEPIRSWLLPLVSSSWELTLNTAKSGLNALWKKDAHSFYMTGLHDRYPLLKNSPHDMKMSDFARFFAPDGIIDGFFKDHLEPFVDTTRREWRGVSMDNSDMGISQRVLKQFQYAAKIRDTFFTAGQKAPSIQFTLKPVFLDENASSFQLRIEGQTTEYRHGPAQTKRFQWPGPQTEEGVRLVFQSFDHKQYSLSEDGEWAWLKILDKAMDKGKAWGDRFILTFQVGSFIARYELQATSANNPFMLEELEKFRCPESL